MDETDERGRENCHARNVDEFKLAAKVLSSGRKSISKFVLG